MRLLAGALPDLLPATLDAQADEPPRPLTTGEYDALVRGEQEPTYAAIPWPAFSGGSFLPERRWSGLLAGGAEVVRRIPQES